MLKEQLFTNGKIFTANDTEPHASAFIVKNGKITWIGDKNNLPYNVENITDLKGKRVIPGIIDAHLHPIYLAAMKSYIPCTFPNIKSIDDLINKVKERRASQSADEWVEGWGYDEGKLSEGRAPTCHDLDKGATDVPVIIRRTCGHIISVNSKALELAGITKDTEEVPGGKIDRDENGEPTGILRESAKDLVLDLQENKTQSEYAEEIADLSQDLLSYGITGISELMAEHEPMDYLQMYEEAIEKGMKQRIAIFYVWEQFQKLNTSKEMFDNSKQAFIGGIKLFTDGSISGLTAWVDDPYLTDPDNHGISTCSKEILQDACEAAEKHNIQLAVHAMGERAIHQILDAVGDKKAWIENAPSLRIEHATFPTEHAIKTAADAGIAFVPQPIFLFAEIETYLKNVGKERTVHSYPIKTLLENNVPVAISSDAPATSWHDPVNPFTGIQSAVTRTAYNGDDTGQDERISTETAVSLYTEAAQYVSNFQNVGKLAVGYEADFVILEEDILDIDPSNISDTTVAATYMSGEAVYKNSNISTSATTI